MAKKLVVFCDGTWNRADKKDRGGHPCHTNVFRLFQATLPHDRQGNPQVVHYIEGVGTRRSERISGGGFGFGISDNIKNAYRFIASNYERGDEIYLFGFSRGAYTARSIAGLIRNMGILKRDKLHLANEAYRRYKDRSKEWHPDSKKSTDFREQNTCRDEAIRCLGVWDTVGALGAPFGALMGWLIDRLFKTGFHDVKLSSLVQSAYHALAIDERRWPFRPTQWKLNRNHLDRNSDSIGKGGIPLYEEKWFPGVHSNVGGGYPGNGLSDCALEWMADRASRNGLNVDLSLICDPNYKPDVTAEIDDSQTVLYRVATVLFVKIPTLISKKFVFQKDSRRLVGHIQPNGDYVRPVNNLGNIGAALTQQPKAAGYEGSLSRWAIQKLADSTSLYNPPNISLPAAGKAMKESGRS